ncbi:conserved protein of unknown function (plasmid) [Rhodovastum atsumiense]|uniref:DUF2213 domain-containing protein n=1 Tax=Rhodovastum atsumiense TaxID=504468 RepID=A0A5M6IVA3_9PROT|nr:DUF2213 domain-containing protein [Rhodovastum atsumiense]KAA5611869.1 DUF2213 domain-containing protein [Rhodovastum atsumiense]CAH2606153.1 conserved protein of unknown function [Rhodovastum atsumiense]
MDFVDSVELAGTRVTRDGYLVADVRVARRGIQVYAGREVGCPELATVRVLRPADEVFSADSMASAAYRPVTVEHPPGMVDARNWKAVTVGFTGGEVARDGDFLRVPLLVADADAIADVRDGKRELSAGYTAKIVFEPGETPEGEAFDARLADIALNHVAIVDAGRAGPQCRIGDASPTAVLQHHKEEPKMDLLTILVDGASIQTTADGAKAVEALTAALRDAKTRADKAEGDIAALAARHGSAIEAKDGEMAALAAAHKAAIEAKDGEIAALAARIPDVAAFDAAIAARSALIDSARKLLGSDYAFAGKTEADIRRAAVAKRLGDKAVDGRSDDYVVAAFDTLVASAAAAPPDPVRDAIRTQAPVTVGDSIQGRADAYREYVEYLKSAHKAQETN